MPNERSEPDWAIAGATMATFTVTTKDDLVNAGDGVLSLREALAAADATPTVADSIKFDVAAMGGNRIVLAGSQLTIASDVTIDGDRNDDGTKITISGGDASRILLIEGNQTDVALSDLVLRDGRELGDEPRSASGGAIRCNGKSLTINDSLFTENNVFSYYTIHSGGAVYSTGTILKITDSTFIGNAGGRGGALAASNGDAETTIANCTFQGNRGVFGGAINVAGDLTMDRSSILSNYAGIYHDGAGGGLVIGGYGLIESSCISSNAGYYGGGGVLANELNIINSTIANNNVVNNYSNFGGGGIRANILTVTNSTVSGNNVAGGLYEDGLGGGIAAGTLSIRNSIVAGNTAAGAGAIPDISAATLSSNGHNIFGSSVAGASSGDLQNVPISLLFTGGLADNGGPTQTIALLDDPTQRSAERTRPMRRPPTSAASPGRCRPAPTRTSVPSSWTRPLPDPPSSWAPTAARPCSGPRATT